MGPAGRLGLCLALSVWSWGAHESASPEPSSCSCLPPALCLNGTHCRCPPGLQPPVWPSDQQESCDDINECLEQPPPCGPHQTCNNTLGNFSCHCSHGYRDAPPAGPPPAGPPPAAHRPPPLSAPANCVDVDECLERRCGGGALCFNTPGSYECHCPPGYGKTPDKGCAATMPPYLCSDNESGCELQRVLTHLYELHRRGRDPRSVLQGLLDVLDQELLRPDSDVGRRHRRVTALLAATEGLVRGVGTLLPPPSDTELKSNSTELRLVVQQDPPPGPIQLQVPGQVELEVPPELAGGSGTGPALVALLVHRGLDKVLGGDPEKQREGPGQPPRSKPGGRPSYRILSSVATALVSQPHPPPSPVSNGTPTVTLRFQHGHQPQDTRRGGQVLCAFWDPRAMHWNTLGCSTQPAPPGTPPGTSCSCNHLTSFAVLLAFREIEEHWVLDLITKVGLGVSVASLLVAVATFLCVRALKGLRTTLHLHLSLSLLLAHSTFLLGIDRTQDTTGCAVVAGLLHFSFLAVFSWMLLEGLHLYVLLVRVFVPSWLRVRHLLLAGYGLPLLLVTISAAAFPRGYSTEKYCWLSLERGFRWSFQGPVCLVILVNAVILVVAVWKLVQKFSDVNPDMGHLRRMRALTATAAGQLCLLGTGWALGLLHGPPQPGGALAPAPLLFCALNTLQGLFILTCHCLAHPKVREAYRGLLCPSATRYSEFTSNTSNTSNTRLPRQTYA